MKENEKSLIDFKEFLLKSLEKISDKINVLRITFDSMPEEDFLDELRRLNSLFSVMEIELVTRDRNDISNDISKEDFEVMRGKKFTIYDDEITYKVTDVNRLWLLAIKDNIVKIRSQIVNFQGLETESVVTNLREQYRLIATLRTVKQRKTTIKGIYRRK